MEERVAGSIGMVQKKLERAIAARSHSRHVPGFRSGKLNSSSLHRLSVGDDRVFKRKQEVKTKDVAVALVVDMSGSMAYSRLPVAMATAYALSSALDRLNIKHEVCGFTTLNHSKIPVEVRKEASGENAESYTRWEAIYQPILKGYDERLTTERIRAISTIEHEVENRENIDGESIEYAAFRLARRHEKRKIIIVLSDGNPACVSYHPNGRRMMDKHLKEVIRRMLACGLEPYAIGIQTSAVEQYYPKSTVINKLEDLPTTVMSAVEEMLLGGVQEHQIP
jgi:cobalamin biosynthesis protein CobT